MKILLVVDVFVRCHEHIEAELIRQTKQLSIADARPPHFLNSRCMVFPSQPNLQLFWKALVDQDTHQAAFCNSKNDSAW